MRCLFRTLGTVPDSQVAPRTEARNSLARSFALGCGAAALAMPFFLRGLVPLDEGLTVHAAERLSRGEVLYRDVATGVAPGLFYLLAALYRVLPPTLELGRCLQALLIGGETALLHRVALRIAPPRAALLAPALFFGTSLFHYRYPNYSPLAVLFQLAGVLLLLRFAANGRRTTVAAAGAVLGLCTLAKQNYGALALLGAAAALSLLRLASLRAGERSPPDRRRGAWRELLRDEAALAAGAAVPIGLAAALLGVAGALPMFWQYSVHGVLEGTATAFVKPYPLLDWRDPFAFVTDVLHYAPFPPATELLDRRLWRPALVPGVLAVYLLPIAVMLLQGSALARGLSVRRPSRALCVLVPSAALFLLGVLPRADYFHLVLVLALVWPLVAEIVGRLPPFARRAAATVLLLFAVGSAAAPYAQLVLPAGARLDTPLSLPRAPWVRAKEAETRGLRAAVRWLAETTEPDEPVLVAPRDPLVYFLAGRRNVSPFPLTAPGAFDLDVLARDLARVDTVLARDTDHDEQPLFFRMPRLWRLLRQSFEVDPRYLDDLQRPGEPLPEVQPLVALRRRERPLPEGAAGVELELLEAVVSQPATLLNPDAGAFPSSAREEARILRAQFLLEPAILLRPPSGWQKVAFAVRARPRRGDALRFAVALRPPQRTERERGADGVFLEVLAYDEEARTIDRVLLERLDARERGSWRWRDVEIPLAAFAGQSPILVIAALPGPSLREVGDEVMVTPPRLVSARDGGEPSSRLDVVPITRLPRPAVDALARFDDPTPFEAALERAAELPPERRARIHLALGLARTRSLGVAAGREHVETAASLAPDDVEAQLAAAELAAASGDAEQALARYAQVLELDPGQPRALAMTALFSLERGELAAARAYAERAVARSPDAEERLVLARVLHQQGEVVRTAEELLAAIAGPGYEPAALELLNHWFVGEVARAGDLELTRGRSLLPDGAFAGTVALQEAPLSRAAPRQVLRLAALVRNESPFVWPALGNEDGGLRVALGLRWRDLRSGVLYDAGRRPLPHDLVPGATETLPLALTAPETEGPYELVLDLVQEGIAWFAERGGTSVVVPLEVTGGVP